MPRYYFDTEFIEDGFSIELISIGIVCEDGREYYAECAEADHGKAGRWVRDNVLPHLVRGDAVLGRATIAADIRVFTSRDLHGQPEFWAYYADYDWVALCQLYGTMMDLPRHFPMFCLDIKQLAVSLGDPRLPKQTSTEHHALADARWNRDAYDYLIAAASALEQASS